MASCISFSDSIFPQHTLDWQENPTVAVVETLAEPIDKIQFPAVSICPQTFNSDRWGPTLKILDHLKPMHPSYGLVLIVLCVLIKIFSNEIVFAEHITATKRYTMNLLLEWTTGPTKKP